MRGLLIAAPASGQGKTTLTLGLLRALSRRGHRVGSAKSGPDYIDPAFHAAATGRPCVTLDAWAAGTAQLRARAAMQPADLLVVEGAMGLYDGADTGSRRPGEAAGGAGSAAALAHALGVPVVLVLDISRTGQSAAAIVHGLASFPGAPPVAGVILNRVGSPRHAVMARRAVEAVRPVMGVLPRDDGLCVPSRHLGLVQAGELADLPTFLDRAADLVEEHCDLNAVLAAAGPVTAPAGVLRRLPPLGQRIAVAHDAAFSFAYWHMLEDWRAQGAEILRFSPLDDQPPDARADAVFLPGGYPELHPGRIAGAARFLAGVRSAVARGATVYGECGGFMVLGDGIVAGDGTRHAMLGLLRLETSVERPTRVLGYRRLTPLAGPWPDALAAHEFHTARTLRQHGPPLFGMRNAAGTDLGTTGLSDGRVSGSWVHLVEPAD
jgi:cobyrinic acid a,c-diamide synthase